MILNGGNQDSEEKGPMECTGKDLRKKGTQFSLKLANLGKDDKEAQVQGLSTGRHASSVVARMPGQVQNTLCKQGRRLTNPIR